jgi:hypothetical protein
MIGEVLHRLLPQHETHRYQSALKVGISGLLPTRHTSETCIGAGESILSRDEDSYMIEIHALDVALNKASQTAADWAHVGGVRHDTALLKAQWALYNKL